MDGERVQITLVGDSDDPRPAEVRLRMVLKRLLRSEGFKCLSVEVVPATGRPRDADPDPADESGALADGRIGKGDKVGGG